RVGRVEGAVAGQHYSLHVVGEARRPSLRSRRRAVDQRMRDGLRPDERMRDHASQEIRRAANGELRRLLRAERVARYRVAGPRVAAGGIVGAAVVEAEQARDPLSDMGERRALVALRVQRGQGNVDHRAGRVRGGARHQGLGMRSVLLIIREPEAKKRRDSGWSVAPAKVHSPPGSAAPMRSYQAAAARPPVRTMLVGIGVPSKYATLPLPAASFSAVTLKRARRLTPQQTK